MVRRRIRIRNRRGLKKGASVAPLQRNRDVVGCAARTSVWEESVISNSPPRVLRYTLPRRRRLFCSPLWPHGLARWKTTFARFVDRLVPVHSAHHYSVSLEGPFRSLCRFPKQCSAQGTAQSKPLLLMTWPDCAYRDDDSLMKYLDAHFNSKSFFMALCCPLCNR